MSKSEELGWLPVFENKVYWRVQSYITVEPPVIVKKVKWTPENRGYTGYDEDNKPLVTYYSSDGLGEKFYGHEVFGNYPRVFNSQFTIRHHVLHWELEVNFVRCDGVFIFSQRVESKRWCWLVNLYRWRNCSSLGLPRFVHKKKVHGGP